MEDTKSSLKREGGLRAAQKVKQKYGKDHYKKLGRLGGLKSRGGGFSSTRVGKDGLTGPQRARVAGQKGGRMSRPGTANKGGNRENNE